MALYAVICREVNSRLVRTMSTLNLPETHYTRSGELNIAYQVMGDGRCVESPISELITAEHEACEFEIWQVRPVGGRERNGSRYCLAGASGGSAGAVGRGAGSLPLRSEGAAQSPAQILVPLTLPTGLHSIGVCGLT
jgi:hypothetical protein